MIEHIKGDCLQDSDIPRFILQVVNNKGGFGKGFALATANKYPEVVTKYKEWYGNSILYNSHQFRMGAIQKIRIDNKLTFINLLCQDGYKTNKNPQPLKYDGLLICLQQVQMINDDREIWIPYLMGCGLAGGDWDKVKEIINEALPDRVIKAFELNG